MAFQEAQLARAMGNGYRLDKSHILVVNIFDDFERYMKVPDEWTAAETKPYTPGVSLLPYTYIFRKKQISMLHCLISSYCIVVLQENLHKWLTDEKARDQFVMRAGTCTEVYWNDARQLSSELIYQHQVLLNIFLLQ